MVRKRNFGEQQREEEMAKLLLKFKQYMDGIATVPQGAAKQWSNLRGRKKLEIELS